MARSSVGARTEGDVYQGLFFWRQAASLLIPESRVSRVVIEHDEAAGVDDVAVYYAPPGVDAGGQMCVADFYQLKYHVDRRTQYSAELLVSPSGGPGSSSMLQRFYRAFSATKVSGKLTRLSLVSNWQWYENDTLARALREYDGALPERFFSAPASQPLGSIRETWRDHLHMTTSDFEPFARSLRLQLDQFGRRDFREWVYDRLARAGLSVPPADWAASEYESLVQQFVMNGPNDFNRSTLEEVCIRHGLLRPRVPTAVSLPVIGIRSLLRFAENLEGETDAFVCVAKYFEGRHAIDQSSWPRAASDIVEYLSQRHIRACLRERPHAIALECHGSLALLAGYELSRNSGCEVYPLQKPGRKLWKPEVRAEPRGEATWSASELQEPTRGKDIVFALSVSHAIGHDVRGYLRNRSTIEPGVSEELKPTLSRTELREIDASQSWALAIDLVRRIRTVRRSCKGQVHLFWSAPNALMFFIGQHRSALGPLVLYEHDLGNANTASYEPSITLIAAG